MRWICCTAIIGLGLSACEQNAGAPVSTEGIVELSAQFTGDFTLIDKNGAVVTDEDFGGKVRLVYFGFTHCPDVCPVDVGVMSAALTELGDEADEVAAIFISVDPERDTPDVLKDYFAFDERIIALTGSVEAAKAARGAFKVYAQKQLLPDSALEYTVQHQRYFFIVDRSGQPRWGIVGGVSPQELADLLRRNIAEI
jgi:protein SCO1/2